MLRDELLEMEKDLREENGHPCHVDTVWTFWNLLDMTSDGRGEASIPIQNYEHAYFSKHVYHGEPSSHD